jgi:Zn-dependent peptidase ImmA (M78 family)/transcriptional regulator with XRE-family HTH domain
LAKSVVGVQGSVLRWARESQGFSIADVAAHLGRELDEISAWESGEEAPTYAQLEKLAYKLYKRPLAVFFLPAPPAEPDLKQEFRTLPDFEIDQLSADTRYQLRIARALQLSLEELNDGSNPAEHKIFLDTSLSPASDVVQAAASCRHHLGISLSTQRAWASNEDALKTWRNAVEREGVAVFKGSFKQREVSGFCLAHDEFPVIYLNNTTAKARQIFSLFHELAHVLLHVSSISKFDESIIERLPQSERQIEQFCNALAAECLMPISDFSKQVEGIARFDDPSIEELANRYHVSREAVLRRILDLDLVTQQYYEQKARQWAQEAEDALTSSKGGNYYATQATYLGESYVRLVFGKYYRGQITLEQVADYLGVRTKSVAGIEELVIGRAPSS